MSITRRMGVPRAMAVGVRLTVAEGVGVTMSMISWLELEGHERNAKEWNE